MDMDIVGIRVREPKSVKNLEISARFGRQAALLSALRGFSGGKLLERLGPMRQMIERRRCACGRARAA